MCEQPSPIEDNEGNKYQAANPTIARRRDELRAGHPFRQRPHIDPRELAPISRPTAIHEIGTNALAVATAGFAPCAWTSRTTGCSAIYFFALLELLHAPYTPNRACDKASAITRIVLISATNMVARSVSGRVHIPAALPYRSPSVSHLGSITMYAPE